MATSQTALNVLLRKFGSDRAALDLEENRARSQYALTTGDLTRNQGLRNTALSEKMADQGLAHSGIANKSYITLADTANRENQRAATALNDLLANIARKRLEAQYAFDTSRLGIG